MLSVLLFPLLALRQVQTTPDMEAFEVVGTNRRLSWSMRAESVWAAFERVGVLEGFRQRFICLFGAPPGTVHTAIERVVRLGGWRQLFSCGTAAPQPMPLDCWPVGPSASAWTRSGATRRL